MVGIIRGNETPLQYATEKVDPLLGTRFGEFMLVYLRLKYGNRNILPGDIDIITSFGKSVVPAAKKKVKWYKRYMKYRNIFNVIRYFRRPEEPASPEQPSQL